MKRSKAGREAGPAASWEIPGYYSLIRKRGTYAIALPPADLGGPVTLAAYWKNGKIRRVFTVEECIRFPCERSAAEWLETNRGMIRGCGGPLVVDLDHFKLPPGSEVIAR